MPISCPDDNELAAAWSQGGALSGQLARHLGECSRCEAVAAALAVSSTAATALPPAVAESPALGEGSQLGRYVVERKVGQGAMGAVYAVHDPVLDRRLAVKILHPLGGLEDDAGRARLLREAKALARVSHRNVVAVHDVGEVDGQVFVAMELVEGRTAAEWAREESPDVERIVAVYRDAARGLAAVHAVGLTHRDFKPDNVLVDASEEAKVVDFGLARPGAAVSAPTGDDPAGTLTRTGTLIGTPVYMAPEQLAGEAADARSDQFSFCVSLWEAVCGCRPFSGKSIGELRRAIRAAALSRDPRMPAWLHRVLARGLAADPAQRWDSMDSLMRRLQRSPARRRTVALAVGGIALGGLLGAFAFAGRDPGPEELCLARSDRLTAAWSEGAGAVERAFSERLGASAAAEMFGQVASRYAADWQQGYELACTDTYDTGVHSAALLDRRLLCLDRRAVAFSELVEEVTRASTATTLYSAVEAARGLPTVEDCADLSRLAEGAAPSGDPRQRELDETLEAALLEAEVHRNLGNYQGGLDVLDGAADAQQQRGDVHFDARFQVERGVLLAKLERMQEVEPALREAVRIANRAGDDELAATAWIEMAKSAGVDGSRAETALAWTVAADAALERLGRPPLLAARWAAAVGAIHLTAGDYDPAEEFFQEALNAYQGLDPQHPGVGASLHNLATVKLFERDLDAAAAQFERAIAARKASLGADHPELARSVYNLALVRRQQGRLDEAEELLDEALAIFEVSFGPESRLVGAALAALAGVHTESGDYEAALEQGHKALEIRRQVLGDDHPLVGLSMNNMAAVLELLGRHGEALAMYEGALERQVAAQGSDHPSVARTHANMAISLWELDRLQEARTHAREALRIRRAALGADHPSVGKSMVQMATLARREKRPREALDWADKALRVYRGAEVRPLDRGEALFEHAQALAAAGQPERALAQARAAREQLVAAGDGASANRQALDDWLADQ